MPQGTNEANEGSAAAPVTISDAIGQLRSELSQSIAGSEGEDLRFLVRDVTVELQVAVERTTAGQGGIKWVVEAGVSRSSSGSRTHTVTITLEPRLSNGGPILTSRE